MSLKNEVEIKARANICRLMNILPADKFEEHQFLEDTYFDSGCPDMSIRVRRDIVANKFYLTVKGKKVGNVRRESEVEVTEGIFNFLRELGKEVLGTVLKHRTVYKIDGVTVCLDDVSGLGTFVEFEVLKEPGEIATIPWEVMNMCGVHDSDIEHRSYAELML